MSAYGTPQSFLYNQRSSTPNTSTEDRSMQQYYTDSGNPYGYVPQGTGVPQNYGNVSQPNGYDSSFMPAIQNRYMPPTLQGNGGNPTQWNNNGLSYQLPAGYGPYNNNGYQLPYFNQSPYSQNGNPNAGLPAYQIQGQSPFMPQFLGGPQNSTQATGGQNAGLPGTAAAPAVNATAGVMGNQYTNTSSPTQAQAPGSANAGSTGYAQQLNNNGFNRFIPAFANHGRGRDGNDFQRPRPPGSANAAPPAPQQYNDPWGFGIPMPVGAGGGTSTTSTTLPPTGSGATSSGATIGATVPYGNMGSASGPVTMQAPRQYSIQPVDPTVIQGTW